MIIIEKLEDLPRFVDVHLHGGVIALDEADDPSRAILVTAGGQYGQRDYAEAVTACRQRRRSKWEIISVNPEVFAVLKEGRLDRHTVSAEELSDAQRKFDEMAQDALRFNASDIHITVNEGHAKIAFRINGRLIPQRTLQRATAEAICKAIYNTFAETGSTKEGFNPNRPLDGMIERKFASGRVRFRFSSLPIAPSGFDVTLRVIHVEATEMRSLAELGYEPEQIDLIRRMFAYSSGMIIVAGATGAGKSTTLATVLRDLAESKPFKKVRTVEEPVEIRIPNVAQTPVLRLNDDGNDFLLMLRQMMRSDPDVIMIGEIRDHDTAALAFNAVRTGHLCATTIHASSVIQTYQRLIGLGVDINDLATYGMILGIIAQTLVPVPCRHCAVPVTVAQDEAAERARKVFGNHAQRVLIEVGCAKCNFTGIVGRTVAAEVMRARDGRLFDALRIRNLNEVEKVIRGERRYGDIEDILSGGLAGRTAFEHALLKCYRGEVGVKGVEDQFHLLDEGGINR